MSSCERPSKRSARDLVPSSVSKLYSFSTGTQGSCRRRSASSSFRRVSSFSFASSSSRSACHSSCVPILCSVIVHSFLGGYLGRFQHEQRHGHPTGHQTSLSLTTGIGSNKDANRNLCH